MPNDCASFCRKTVPAPACGLALVYALTLVITGLLADPAEARGRAHHERHSHAASHHRGHTHRGLAENHLRHRHRQLEVARQDVAMIVVDANSGRTLYAREEDDLRHPASITKVMTLYLLFEQLEKGRLRLDSMLPISAHAAAQAPTKLGLRPGDSISVENAIKAVVTRSANDIAVAIAEAVGEDEEIFAEMMTRKAHALGMVRTHFANASGLPHDEQVTTAKDLALLGRAIQDHFPRYYRYFATQSFTYKGAAIRNHNHLLERVEGMDGIKTGYTRASGFNLLASVRRDGHHIVAVVLGGRTAGHRDRIMADLIEDQIEQGARTRTAAAIPAPGNNAVATGVARPAVAPASVEFPADRIVAPQAEPKLPFVPVSLKPGLTVDTAPMRGIGLAAPVDRPRPAYVAASPRPRPDAAALAPAETIPPRAAIDGSTRAPVSPSPSDSTATPSSLRRPRAFAQPDDLGTDRTAALRQADRGNTADVRRSPVVRGDWMIQIGATNDLAKANDLLARAKLEGAQALGAAKPTTEKVQKGSEILYRARFVGLEAETAESACKTLKRSGFACFAARN